MDEINNELMIENLVPRPPLAAGEARFEDIDGHHATDESLVDHDSSQDDLDALHRELFDDEDEDDDLVQAGDKVILNLHAHAMDYKDLEIPSESQIQQPTCFRAWAHFK